MQVHDNDFVKLRAVFSSEDEFLSGSELHQLTVGALERLKYLRDNNPLAEQWFQKYNKSQEVLIEYQKRFWEIEDVLAKALGIPKDIDGPYGYGEENHSRALAKKAADRIAELER